MFWQLFGFLVLMVLIVTVVGIATGEDQGICMGFFWVMTLASFMLAGQYI